MKAESDLDRRILEATERPPVVRARRWKPRFDKLPALQQWEQAVEQTLASALYLERRRRERQGKL